MQGGFGVSVTEVCCWFEENGCFYGPSTAKSETCVILGAILIWREQEVRRAAAYSGICSHSLDKELIPRGAPGCSQPEEEHLLSTLMDSAADAAK